jgi:hypothetical protein
MSSPFYEGNGQRPRVGLYAWSYGGDPHYQLIRGRIFAERYGPIVAADYDRGESLSGWRWIVEASPDLIVVTTLCRLGRGDDSDDSAFLRARVEEASFARILSADDGVELANHGLLTPPTMRNVLDLREEAERVRGERQLPFQDDGEHSA